MTSLPDPSYETYRTHYERMGNLRPSVEVVPDIARVDAWKPWMRGLPGDAKILDCGCGFGHQLLALKHLGFVNLHGIEIVEDSCRIAREELAGAAEVTLADAFEYLPRHAGEFDVVILNDVLEHVPREHTVPLLRLIRSALKPGGVVHLRVPNMSSLLASYSMFLDVTHVTGFTEYSLMQALDLAGFEHHRLVSSRPRLLWTPRMPRRMGLRLVRLLLWLADVALHRVAYLLRAQLPLPRETSINLELYSTRRA